MEKYTLKNTFPNAQCPEELQDVVIKKINADIKTRTIKADILLEKVVDEALLQNFCRSVKEEYSLENFELNVAFDMENADTCECVRFCIDKIGSDEPFYKAIFDCCFVTECDNEVKVTLRHGNEDLLLEEGIDRKISDSLKRNFGIDEKQTSKHALELGAKRRNEQRFVNFLEAVGYFRSFFIKKVVFPVVELILSIYGVADICQRAHCRIFF